MAPPRVTRRTSNQPTSSSQQQQQQQQQQLSFRTGGSAMKPSTSTTTSPTQDPKNKISKPLSAAARASLSSSAGTKARKSLLSKQVVTPQEAVNVVDVGIQPEPQVDSVIIQQQQQQQQQDGGEVKEEVKGEDAQTALAKKITQAQIVRYWSGREAQRMAPRVHQGGLAVREKVLREFDMSSRYGVCCFHVSPPLLHALCDFDVYGVLG